MEPLTLLTIAGTFAWQAFKAAGKTAGGGVLEGQSDKYFCDIVRQIKEKLGQSNGSDRIRRRVRRKF